MGWRSEQKIMYFRMMPLSLRGGSQETNTAELLAAAAFTPAGAPGTAEEEQRVGFTTPSSTHFSGNIWILTILFGADIDLLATNAVASAGEGQHLDAIVGVLLQAIQLQRRLNGGHIPNFPQFCKDERKSGFTLQTQWINTI